MNLLTSVNPIRQQAKRGPVAYTLLISSPNRFVFAFTLSDRIMLGMGIKCPRDTQGTNEWGDWTLLDTRIPALGHPHCARAVGAAAGCAATGLGLTSLFP
jgi:hypothetical protein